MALKKRKLEVIEDEQDETEETSVGKRGRRKLNPDAKPIGFLVKGNVTRPKSALVTVTFPEQDADWLSRFADKNGMSRSDLVKQLILYGLARLKQELPITRAPGNEPEAEDEE